MNLQTKEKEYIDVSKELFEMIPDKIEKLSEVFAEKYLDIPIMKYYNMNTLFERMLLLENEDLVLLKDLFVARYEKVTDIENEDRNIRLLKRIEMSLENLSKSFFLWGSILIFFKDIS